MSLDVWTKKRAYLDLNTTYVSMHVGKAVIVAASQPISSRPTYPTVGMSLFVERATSPAFSLLLALTHLFLTVVFRKSLNLKHSLRIGRNQEHLVKILRSGVVGGSVEGLGGGPDPRGIALICWNPRNP